MRASRRNPARHLVGTALAVAMTAHGIGTPAVLRAQAPAPSSTASTQKTLIPPGYVIGIDDVLSIVVWREEDLSSEVVVRPDGMISLPLINDVSAVGRTPEELRQVLEEAASKFVDEPTVGVSVKAINSRRVYIQGQVGSSGAYPLSGPLTVMQLIALAGGLQDWANEKRITILRSQNGRSLSIPFNYRDIMKGRNLEQNIQLMPGDVVNVP